MTRFPRQTCLSSPRTFAPAGVSLLCACTEGLGALHRGSRRSRPRNNSDTCPHKHALSPRTLTSTTRQSFVRARTHPSDPLCLPSARVLPSSCRAWPCPVQHVSSRRFVLLFGMARKKRRKPPAATTYNGTASHRTWSF